MAEPKVEILVRTATDDDIDFITSSWLESMRHTGYMSESVPNEVFYKQHHKVIEGLLPDSLCVVACNADDPSQIFGWICASIVDGMLCIHYCYVKQSFRRFGLASRLLKLLRDTQNVASNILLTTHWTRMSKKLLRDRMYKGTRVVYSPYLLFQMLGDKWWR